MKCIKNGSKIQRISDDKAFRLVHEGKWQYCPKSEWKDSKKK